MNPLQADSNLNCAASSKGSCRLNVKSVKSSFCNNPRAISLATCKYRCAKHTIARRRRQSLSHKAFFLLKEAFSYNIGEEYTQGALSSSVRQICRYNKPVRADIFTFCGRKRRIPSVSCRISRNRLPFERFFTIIICMIPFRSCRMFSFFSFPAGFLLLRNKILRQHSQNEHKKS